MDTKFWELSIYFPRELLCYFNDFKTDLKAIVKDEANCVSIFAQDKKNVFMLALSSKAKNQHILYIKQRIAEIILLYYKPKNIVESIKNFDIAKHDNVVLIDILSSFDYEVDIDYIVQNLSLINQLYISSFVSFKLGYLTKKWQDIGGLINENRLFLLDNKVKGELMQFLMQGIVKKPFDAKIFVANGRPNLKLCNKIVACPKLFYFMYDFDNLLFALVKNCPKNICVKNYKVFDALFIQTLSNLFGDALTLA